MELIDEKIREELKEFIELKQEKLVKSREILVRSGAEKYNLYQKALSIIDGKDYDGGKQ